MPLAAVADLWLGRSKQTDADEVARVKSLTPVVVVTGASRGIGLAIALRFAAAGAQVALVGRSPDSLDKARARFTSAGIGKAPVLIACDITGDDAWERIGEALAAAGGYADVFVNNAGLGLSGAFVSQDADDIQALVDTNVSALSRLTRLALPPMLARGRGGIINVASLGGLTPGPYQAAYYASKAYVVSLTRAVSREVAGRGVRVCCVVPGPVNTSFHGAMGAESALYRLIVPALSSEQVAASTYRGYCLGHGLIAPGVITSLVSKAIGVIPYPLLVPAVGLLLDPGDGKRSRDKR